MGFCNSRIAIHGNKLVYHPEKSVHSICSNCYEVSRFHREGLDCNNPACKEIGCRYADRAKGDGGIVLAYIFLYFFKRIEDARQKELFAKGKRWV